MLVPTLIGVQLALSQMANGGEVGGGECDDAKEDSRTEYGTQNNDAPDSRDSVDKPVSDSNDGYDVTVQVTATAYTAECEGCSGITAMGVDVRDTTTHEGKRVIAVDPTLIPLGSDVTVTLNDGTQLEAVAADTGGAIDGNRIDILMETHDEAVQFGRQDVEVTIENEGGR